MPTAARDPLFRKVNEIQPRFIQPGPFRWTHHTTARLNNSADNAHPQSEEGEGMGPSAGGALVQLSANVHAT